MATEAQLKYWESMMGRSPPNKGKKMPEGQRLKMINKIKINCAYCGKEMERIPARVKRGNSYCDNICRNKAAVGRQNSPNTQFKKGVQSPRYNKGSGFLDNQGYKAFMVDGKKRLEHHLIYCLANKIDKIPDGHDIHHINGIKTDNRIENLMLLTKSEHSALHWQLGKRIRRGE